MADQYIGDDVVVEFNTVDISGTARTVTLDQTADEPPDIDCTHKGDTSQNLKEGIPGEPKTSVTVEGLDEVGGVAAIKDFAILAQDTLLIYPEGKVHTYPMVTVQNARFLGLVETIPYDDVVSFTASFSAKNSATYSTYDSAP